MLAAAILVGAAPTAAASPPAPRHPCDAIRHARVVAASPEAQIFRGENRLSQPNFYGCAYGGRQGAHVLGPVTECTPSGCVGTDRLTLSGATAAYEEFSISPEAHLYLVIVRDLRSGRVMRRLPTGGGLAKDIVVSPVGAVAWIATYGLEYVVHAVDATGSRVLARGPDIAPRSLALAGKTLYWTQAGKTSSAPLG
jgi:hypothetical protein